MNLEKLYKLQSELDDHILENAKKRNIVMSDEELLDKTILALLVEVGELANATRCFKHWSLKGSESKERLLDELADIWHFYLSIGNQKEMQFKTISLKSMEEVEETFGATGKTREEIIIETFIGIYHFIGVGKYKETGKGIRVLGWALGFKDEEVEQAYLKKHEENYRRQREGY